MLPHWFKCGVHMTEGIELSRRCPGKLREIGRTWKDESGGSMQGGQPERWCRGGMGWGGRAKMSEDTGHYLSRVC